MTDAEAQLASYFAKYDPPIATLGRELRAKLRARLPGLFEIVYVYEGQSALVIAYSATEHGYEGLCSLGVYPDEVKLFFAQGARLAKSDPSKLLRGRGNTVRHVVMSEAADFDRPEMQALIGAASELAELRLDASAEGSVILKAEAQKKRRAKSAARPASSRPTSKPRR